MKYDNEINAYHPTAETIALMRDTKLVLLAGITGSGRDTMIAKLTERGGYYPYVTCTTREMRINNGVQEVEGVEYYFISTERALDMMRNHEFVEVSNVHGRINGLSVKELQYVHSLGKIGITDFTTAGVDKCLSISDNVIAIFVVPPSFDAWVQRIKSRYADESDFHASWPPRRESAIQELQDALDKPYYRFVINDVLSRAVEQCDKIAHGEYPSAEENNKARSILEHFLDRLRMQETV